MLQFIPFEDDWDALENLRPEQLVPYHVDVPCWHDIVTLGGRAQPMAFPTDSAAPTPPHQRSTFQSKIGAE